jgi:F-type H+-transporting ATPase subunit b
MFDSRRMRFDCHHRGLRARLRAIVLAMLVMAAAAAAPASLLAVQEHEAATETEAPHGQTILQSIAKVVNFAILGGVLFYFLKTPIRTYLVSRATHIRQDLVTASEMRAAASAQLVEIERKLQALPAELDALKAQGAEDVKAEQARIAQAAAAERERLIAQTRREIDTRLRMARRQLTEHAAELAVRIAEERIKRTITPEDQLRLVDRYAAQLRDAP